MGNATSCTPSIISNTGSIKVVSANGTLQVYTKPLKAADLMLQSPGHFVCDSSGLVVGNRIVGLSADEELERRRSYFILPMELLYSALTDEEMSGLSHKASRALKRHVKIFPEFCLFPSEASSDEDDGEVGSVEKLYSKQRSWRPALETIAETPTRV